MDVDYSPTGREFVAGSYDRSVRIFPFNHGHSREVYHTKRMQHVFATRFSGDATYVFSGSADMNVRIWKVCAYSTGLTSMMLFCVTMLPRTDQVQHNNLTFVCGNLCRQTPASSWAQYCQGSATRHRMSRPWSSATIICMRSSALSAIATYQHLYTRSVVACSLKWANQHSTCGSKP